LIEARTLVLDALTCMDPAYETAIETEVVMAKPSPISGDNCRTVLPADERRR
jgi:hypothetical protein